jgi:hypothetical protein
MNDIDRGTGTVFLMQMSTATTFTYDLLCKPAPRAGPREAQLCVPGKPAIRFNHSDPTTLSCQTPRRNVSRLLPLRKIPSTRSHRTIDPFRRSNSIAPAAAQSWRRIRSHRLERSEHVFHDVVGMFEADGDADQRVGRISAA